VKRFPAGRFLQPALLLCLAAGCHSKTQTRFVPTPVPSAAYALTATLDSCGCARCRLFVEDPANGLVLLDRTDPLPGLEMTVTDCYSELDPNLPANVSCGSGPVEQKVTVGLECGGGCVGAPPCTASATVRADGTVLPMPGQTSAPTATCTTLATVGAECQDLETVCIPAAAPVINCLQ
jgi:hypothetical protein